MKTKPLFITGIFILTLLGVSFSADQIILKEGKTLTGKITDEDADSVSIRLGPNMYLQVEKSKIKEIIRPEKPKPKGPVLTMDSMKKKATPSPAASPSPKSSPSLTAVPSVEPKKAMVPKESGGASVNKDAPVTTHKVGNVTVEEETFTQDYEVKGKTWEEANDNIFDMDHGKGFLGGKKRFASKTKMALEWEGKAGKEGTEFKWDSAKIKAGFTQIYPQWVDDFGWAEADKLKADEFLEELKQSEQGHLKIYQDFLLSLAEAFSGLRGETEVALKKKSKDIVTELLSRVEKKQEGYNRREARPKPSKP